MPLMEFSFADIRDGHLLCGLDEQQKRMLSQGLNAMLWIGETGGRIEGRERAVGRMTKALTRLAWDLSQGSTLDDRLLDAAIRYAQHDPSEFKNRNLNGQNGHQQNGHRHNGHNGHANGVRKQDVRFRGFRCELTPRTHGQSELIQAIDAHEMVVGAGPAGTGKTWIAVAMGLTRLERGQVDRMIVARPAVEAGEHLGFLPGDMKEKIDPYMRPIFDAADDLIGRERMAKLMHEGRIEVAPLAFMRGRTFKNAFAILDEAQNATFPQLRMFLTRMGEGSRMVVVGDPSQVDLPPGVHSGLEMALPALRRVPGVAVVGLDERDVVRHPIVQGVIQAFGDLDLK